MIRQPLVSPYARLTCSLMIVRFHNVYYTDWRLSQVCLPKALIERGLCGLEMSPQAGDHETGAAMVAGYQATPKLDTSKTPRPARHGNQGDAGNRRGSATRGSSARRTPRPARRGSRTCGQRRGANRRAPDSSATPKPELPTNPKPAKPGNPETR